MQEKDKRKTIKFDDVEKAIEYLKDNAIESARARAERIYMEEFRKSLKAMLAKQFSDLPISAQEREAYAHPNYTKHLEALQQAVFNDEYHRFMRQSAIAKIDAWRTLEANNRAIDRAG